MLRSTGERFVQSVACETGWFIVAIPVYALLFQQPVMQSGLLVVALWLAALAWSPIFNFAFDLAELRLAARVASDRPARLRLAHASGLEASSMAATAPIIMVIGGHGLIEAIAIDIGLSILDAVYTFLFHLAYDRVRPVRALALTASTGVQQRAGPGSD